MKEIKAVVFDIDGTVTPNANSWLDMTRDLGASVEEHLILYQAFNKGRISYEDSKRELLKLWRDTGRATRSQMEGIFMSWPILPEAEELISFLRDKGLHVAFITGSMGMYAEIIAKKFSVLDYHATGELVFDDAGDLVDFQFPPDGKDHKFEQLLTFCDNKSIIPQNVIALGDGMNDLEIFSVTNRGILVGSEKPEALKKVAWKETASLSEAKELLATFLGGR